MRLPTIEARFMNPASARITAVPSTSTRNSRSSCSLTDRPRVRLLAVLLTTVAGCEPQPNTLPPPGREEPVEEAARPQAVAQVRYHIARPLYELTDSADRVARYQEQAIGVVVPTYGEAAPQELSVVNDTAYEIQTVARLRFYPRADGGWTDTLWTREPSLYGGLIRATHDDYGLPVVAVKGRWLRVHYAFAADGAARSGWVQLVPNKSVYHDRDRQMFEFSTDLADASSTEFYATPRGARVALDLTPSHTLRVLRVADGWIQVVLMRPDTSPCTGDEGLRVARRDTVWVRRFNAQGKRTLTSAVAGC